MKNHADIRIDFNEAISGTYERSKQCMEDIRFAKVPGSQWAGADNEQFKNKPKPENNKIAKQINRILGQYQRLEMNAKIVPGSDEATDADASLLQGRWRNDFNMSDGVEALNNAADEAFHGGFGAFKLVAEYDDPDNPNDSYQHISVKPVYSAPSCVFFSAGALRKDKRDSQQAWHLIRGNRKELEEQYGVSIASWSAALDFFDWQNDTSKDVYICHYYEVVEKQITVYDFGMMKITRDKRTYYDEVGQKMDPEEAKKLIDENEHEAYRQVVQYVEYALLDGAQFLEKPRKTPFRTPPIIPQYGYHTVINGIEYYCGEVARQRDNQRFLNMGFGAMMQIMAEDQVEKPEFLPEQVQRFAQMHSRKTIENYSYLLSDPIKDKDGNITHVGPIGKHQPPQLGSGLAAALEMLNGQINEQGGTGQSTLPANVSGDAIQQVNDRADDSYQVMFQNAMQSMKAACEIWIPAAKKLYFNNERKLRVQAEDGAYSMVMTLQYMVDPMTNVYGPWKNSARGRYDVVIRAGESHKATKDAERQSAMEILQYADTSTPMGQMALLTAIMSTTGEGTEDIRRLARVEQMKIMLSNGVDPKPESDEEQVMVMQIMQQLAGQQQPDPAMVLAMAEQEKAVAERENAQVKAFDAQTKRLKVGVEAEKIGADIEKIRTETQGKQLENMQKVGGFLTGFA